MAWQPAIRPELEVKVMAAKPNPCPCGGSDYTTCCGRYHAGVFAPDAESLMKPLAIRLGRQTTPANALVMMRSRYSAYVLKLGAYLLATWHPDTRPATLDLSDDKWLGLEIKKHIVESSSHATVEFVARYKIAGRAHRLHEISRFVQENGQWYYVNGNFPQHL